MEPFELLVASIMALILGLFLYVIYAVLRIVIRVLTGRRPWWRDG